MWEQLFDIDIDFLKKPNLTINKISPIAGGMRIVVNDDDTLFRKAIYGDFMKQAILYHYQYTKNDKNRLIDMKEGIIYINKDQITKHLNTPIFKILCNYYIKKNQSSHFSNEDAFDIRMFNFIPKTNINKKIFTNVKNKEFKIELFDYQKKSIMRMLEIENSKNMTFDFNTNITIGDINISWDPLNEDIATEPNTAIIKSKGGILADMMGLGKTITMLGLMHYGKTFKPNEITTNKIYSMATLIVVPSHLAKQWSDEANKAFKKSKNILIILTKQHHENITYEDVIIADIIIITFQFLTNLKHYAMLSYKQCTPSQFNISERDEKLDKLLKKIIVNDKYKECYAPLFEFFHFNRLIVDEGHEIMEALNCHYSGGKIVNRFIHNFLKTVNASYKWYVSGTPFTTINGLENVLNYLNAELVYENIVHPIKHINKRPPSYYGDEREPDFPSLSNHGVLRNLLSCVTIRHLQSDVDKDVKMLGYKENIEWIDLTEGEKRIYESKASNPDISRRTLLQICCHPLISQEFRNIIGNMISLEDVEAQLISHHKKVIEDATKKIEKLDKTNQAYHMLLNKFNTMISESKYMLGMLERIQNNVEFNEDTNCIVCFDNMTDPVLTHCGHMFCRECIMRCLDIKPECPLCKNNISSDKLLLLNKVEKTQETNPLVAKYGAKLGKLIQMVRTLLSQDARIIIFSQWDDMLTLMKRSMAENGVECSFIAGNAAQRNKAISRFKLGGNNNVLLLSLNRSASGTNLTEATHIFFIEPVDESKENIMAIESQAIARAVRLGQTHKVEIIRILCKDTIEEEIYKNKYNY
jgi:SNF2 family DNA or RNA helicase